MERNYHRKRAKVFQAEEKRRKRPAQLCAWEFKEQCGGQAGWYRVSTDRGVEEGGWDHR